MRSSISKLPSLALNVLSLSIDFENFFLGGRMQENNKILTPSDGLQNANSVSPVFSDILRVLEKQ
jgi:hypothetical protein